MDIKILENLLQMTIERRNLWKRQDQIIYKRIMVDLRLLTDSRWIDKVNSQEGADSETFFMGSDAAEFVKKTTKCELDRKECRTLQNQVKSILLLGECSCLRRLNAATFKGKNFSTIQSVVKNHESLTLKQMFDVTEQLVNNQEEINGLVKIHWGKNSWRRLSLTGDETVINLQRTKACLLRFCVVFWKGSSTS